MPLIRALRGSQAVACRPAVRPLPRLSHVPLRACQQSVDEADPLATTDPTSHGERRQHVQARPRRARAHSPHALRKSWRRPDLVLRPREQRLVVVVEQQAALRGRQRRLARPGVRVGHARDELEALARGRPGSAARPREQGSEGGAYLISSLRCPSPPIEHTGHRQCLRFSTNAAGARSSRPDSCRCVQRCACVGTGSLHGVCEGL